MSTLMKPVRNANKFQEMLNAESYAKEAVKPIYDNMPGYARENISLDEFAITALRVKKTLTDYSDEPRADYSLRAIARNLGLWATQKANKIRAMKKCEGYDDDEPFKLMHNEKSTREIDGNTVYNAMQNLAYLENIQGGITACVIAPIVDIWWSYGYALNETAINEIKYHLESFATIYKGTGERIYFRYPDGVCRYWRDWDLITTTRDYGVSVIDFIHKVNKLAKIEPHEGQKFSKYLLKLLKVVFDDEVLDTSERKRRFEQYYAELADACNPATFTREVVLSVDPVDYLMMSHGNSWSSCYAINSNWGTGTYEGCYSCGTWSYMTDECTMIMYQPSSETNEDGVAYKTKVFRQCVMFNDQDLLLTSRLYPSKASSSQIVKEFRHFAQNFISEMYNITNYWVAKDRDDSDMRGTMDMYVIQHEEFRGYYDVEHYRELMYLSIPKANYSNFAEYLSDGDHFEMYIGNVCYDPIYGDEMGGTDEDNCRYIGLRPEQKICEECHCIIDTQTDDYVEDDNGNYYCGDCCLYCEYHEEYEPPCTDGSYVDFRYSERWVCDEGIGRMQDNGDLFYCDECGRYFNENGGNNTAHWSEADEKVYCDDCWKAKQEENEDNDEE